MHVIASIILPSSSQLWAEATSSLNGVSTVCSRDSTFQLLPYARYRRFRRCPDKVRLSAARGDPCEMLREANPLLIPKQQRQSTVAPFMQPALSASSAVLPATSSLSLSLSSNATGFDQDDAAGLAAERAFDCHLLEQRLLLKLLHVNAPSRCSHPRGQSIPAPAGRAAPAQVFEPAILTPAVPVPERRRKLCPKGHACMDAAAVQLPLPLQLSYLTGSLLLEDFNLQPYTVVFLIDYSNLPGPADSEGRQLNRPTT